MAVSYEDLTKHINASCEETAEFFEFLKWAVRIVTAEL